MKKILIIDDEWKNFRDWMQAIQEAFAPEIVIVLDALTVEQARVRFLENSNLDLVIVDGCMTTDERFDTGPLIEEMSRTFRGPMLANSRSKDLREKMIELGCTHQNPKKERTAHVAAQLLRHAEKK